jgi:hypothetical protein
VPVKSLSAYLPKCTRRQCRPYPSRCSSDGAAAISSSKGRERLDSSPMPNGNHTGHVQVFHVRRGGAFKLNEVVTCSLWCLVLRPHSREA